jgi:hypothetical protein
MRNAILAAFALMASGAAYAASAGDGGEEIVITAQRFDEFGRLTVPHVAMAKRADFALIHVELRDDSRDLSVRRNEIRQTLTSLEARAKAGAVTVALEDEDAGLVRAFSVAAAMENLSDGRQPDSSKLSILIRTPIRKDDTLDAVHKRFSDFIDSAQKPGRIEMELGDLELSVVDPEQYRADLLTQIAQDGQKTSAALGDRYAAQLSGLERRVAWQRTGDLDLTLFIPYKLDVGPAAQP